MDDLSKIVLEHKAVLYSYMKTVKTTPNSTISEAYSFIKQIANIYYVNNKMSQYYNSLVSLILYLEAKCLGHKNMLEFSKKIDISNSPDKEDLLNYIIWSARKYIMGPYVDDEEELYNWNFQYQCVDASNYIYHLCSENGIKCQVVTIYPGYDPSAKLDIDISKHCFNVVEYNSKYYLIDITYAQFFNKSNNHLDRLGVAGLEGPNVGCYILHTPKGENIAKKILTDGYIELDEDVFKNYMDAFTLSFRNGLFYEKENSSFCIPYSVDDYKKFLSGTDSQLKHEKLKCLGRQKRPLNNLNINFKKI